MTVVERVYRYFHLIKIIGVWISGISLFSMMGFIVADVLLRNVFSDSINGGFEIVQNYLMPLAIFPGLAYVYSSGVLPKMELIIEKLNHKVQKLLIYFMIIMEIFVLVLVVQFTWNFALEGLSSGAAFPAGGVLYPVYPLYFIIPVVFTLIIIENIFVVIKNLNREKASLLYQSNEANEES